MSAFKINKIIIFFSQQMFYSFRIFFKIFPVSLVSAWHIGTLPN
ncbi:MAG: hypothetical protein E3J83_01025 [Candidatus Atribacteria bacterium]|nr:MAG: hypothetical protein E3J83_01025 [Candidatus Atribacteria bacterium]